jgi:hypothetical protein
VQDDESNDVSKRRQMKIEKKLSERRPQTLTKEEPALEAT